MNNANVSQQVLVLIVTMAVRERCWTGRNSKQLLVVVTVSNVVGSKCVEKVNVSIMERINNSVY